MASLITGDGQYLVTTLLEKLAPVDRDWLETQIHNFIHKKEIDPARMIGMLDGYKVGVILTVGNSHLEISMDAGTEEPMSFFLLRVNNEVKLVSSVM